MTCALTRPLPRHKNWTSPKKTVASLPLVSRPSDTTDLDLSTQAPSTQAPSSTPLSKRQLRRQRQKTVRLCSLTTKEAEHQLLAFLGSVNGYPARILINGGAEGNVLSKCFQQKHQLPRSACSPIPIVLSNGSSTLTSHTVPITLERDAYSASLNPILYPLSKYDLILSKPWLTQVDPKIRWKANTLYFNHGQQPVTWVCRGFKAQNIQSLTHGRLLTHALPHHGDSPRIISALGHGSTTQ